MPTYAASDFAKRYEDLTQVAVAHCTFTKELVGGSPADKKGIEQYVEHHLHLVGDEAEKAVERILREEVPTYQPKTDNPQPDRNESDTSDPAPPGELDERLTYGLTVLRRDEYGPWIGDWMVKACMKAAASRLGLFVKKRGSKGDVTEMGRVQAIPPSFRNPANLERIYLIAPDGGSAAQTYFHTFKGRVQAPTGSVSIVSDKECAPVGTKFSFEFRFAKGKLINDDVLNIFAAMQNIGLGSAKAFERGQFQVDSLELD